MLLKLKGNGVFPQMKKIENRSCLLTMCYIFIAVIPFYAIADNSSLALSTESVNPPQLEKSTSTRVIAGIASEMDTSAATLSVPDINAVISVKDDTVVSELPIKTDEKAINGENLPEVHESAVTEVGEAITDEYRQGHYTLPFSMTNQEMVHKFILSDGIREYSDETVNQLPLALPFNQYVIKSNLTANDFTDKAISLSTIQLAWANSLDPLWQPAAGESLCNTKANGNFLLTVTAIFSEGIEITKSYKFKPRIGICYLKPADLTIAGENLFSTDFDPAQGFNAGAKVKFPTTGFKEAKFDVVLNQPFPKEYRLQSSHQDKGVNVSGYFAEPTVTLVEKPEGIVTLYLLNESGQIQNSYSFIISTWFANGNDRSLMWMSSDRKSTPVSDFCNSFSKTNKYRTVPIIDVTNGKPATESTPQVLFKRAIGEGLIPEWGMLPNYKGAWWFNSYYWLRDRATNTSNPVKFYSIYLKDGALLPLYMTGKGFIMCAARKSHNG